MLSPHTRTHNERVFGQGPGFPVYGRHGESQDAETAMESLFDYRFLLRRGEYALIFIWLMDVGKYGQGIIGHYWDKETFTLTKTVEQPKCSSACRSQGPWSASRSWRSSPGMRGISSYNIRPKDFLTDLQVSRSVPDGEFCIVQDKVALAQDRDRGRAGKVL